MHTLLSFSAMCLVVNIATSVYHNSFNKIITIILQIYARYQQADEKRQ